MIGTEVDSVLIEDTEGKKKPGYKASSRDTTSGSKICLHREVSESH